MNYTPAYWRNLAQQTRVLAESMADREEKRMLLEIAEAYERLAELAKAHKGQ